MLKFIVISDTHIVPHGKLSNGLDAAARLERAISHVNTLHPDAAFCVFAGDLTDDGDRPAYERLACLIAPLAIPAILTLGNHDKRGPFRDVFGSGHAAETGFADRVVDAGGYRVIVLDSLEADTDAGALAPEQNVWLDERLREARGVPLIVVLHHPLAALGVPTDPIRLREADRLAEKFRGHGDVRQVISGHVHMSTAGSYRGIPFTTIGGCHYTMEPRLGTDPEAVPRRDGPGQIGVVLAGPDGVVVHHENFLDRHIRQPAELHGGPPAVA